MQTASQRFIWLLLVFSMPMGLSYAADESMLVKAWLAKMIKAEHSVSYQGTLIYRYSDEMVAMNIVRTQSDNGMLEHLTSLNGTPGEVVRNPHQVTCLLPNVPMPLVYDNLKIKKGAVEMLQHRIDEIEQYYQLSLAEVTPVAGRMSQKVVIKPRDKYRYGYQFWIDQQSGLLLKLEHLAADGRIMEQMIYSNVDIYSEALPPEVRELHAIKPVDGNSVAQLSSPQVKNDGANNWTVKYIPNGFALADYQRRNNAQQNNEYQMPFEHIVFSDGLASVSVFIEKQGKSGPFNGVSQRGAMNAYIASVDDYQVVVVGEVPLETLELIGESVRHSPESIH